MILVDTSVWVDFFAGRDLPHVAKLEQLILDDDDLALCGIVLTEILQGIADDAAHRRVRRYLSPLLILPMPETVLEAQCAESDGRQEDQHGAPDRAQPLSGCRVFVAIIGRQ